MTNYSWKETKWLKRAVNAVCHLWAKISGNLRINRRITTKNTPNKIKKSESANYAVKKVKGTISAK